jgi:hypothetical protein
VVNNGQYQINQAIISYLSGCVHNKIVWSHEPVKFTEFSSYLNET